MPYAISESGGQSPFGRLGWRAIRDASEAKPEEAVVEEPPGENEVWDEAAGGLRPMDPSEELEAAKAGKRNELILAADEAYRVLFVADIEKDYILLRRAFGLSLTQAQQNQAQQARQVVEKLQTKLQAADAAAAASEVEAVVWGA